MRPAGNLGIVQAWGWTREHQTFGTQSKEDITPDIPDLAISYHERLFWTPAYCVITVPSIMVVVPAEVIGFLGEQCV
jgi:hypothetical protein